MVRVADVLAWVDSHAPFRYAAGWDQCGLQVGDPDAAVRRVLVALDPGAHTIAEALERGCQCLVTHHPLLFRPIKAVRSDAFPGRQIIAAIRGGVSLIAAHTNLDVARQGTNDRLAELLELEGAEALEVEAAFRDEERYGGMGRVGMLPQSVELAGFARELGKVLGDVTVRAVGDPRRVVRRIALCTGSGGSLVDLAVLAKADAYVTGDIKYHEAQSALEAGVALLDVGHFASERLIVTPLAEYLVARARREGVELEVFAASNEKDPFWYSF